MPVESSNRGTFNIYFLSKYFIQPIWPTVPEMEGVTLDWIQDDHSSYVFLFWPEKKIEQQVSSFIGGCHFPILAVHPRMTYLLHKKNCIIFLNRIINHSACQTSLPGFLITLQILFIHKVLWGEKPLFNFQNPSTMYILCIIYCTALSSTGSLTKVMFMK